ncbi:tetratricopeptide repeat protein [Rufibacter sediminis]|uniref:Tetratricopeptide repeat protein n=1 Tax=Rufibacter sediminis TaxID=2762756 RepID=A0ABR6VQR2_9BACT|nr:tetratricopeptide repeat protein [Rufibacter sediminis]MBC3539537.1 tetratricopeptide repeat protein [Rufibacter sediminis]
MKRTLLLTWLLTIGCLGMVPQSSAQGIPEQMALAKEYLRQNDYAKAEALFSKLVEQEVQFGLVYPDYLKTLLGLRNYKEADKLVKRAQKKYPDVPAYAIDEGRVLQASGNTAAAEKKWAQVVQTTTPENVYGVATSFQQADMLPYAEQAYLRARQLSGSEKTFAPQLLQLYAYQRKSDLLVDEVLRQVKNNAVPLTYAQNLLQNTLRDEESLTLLEQRLMTAVQAEPEATPVQELLIWTLLQRKDFGPALMQTRALDRRTQGGGARVLSLADISLRNKDYATAIEGYTYVMEQYRTGELCPIARQRIIQAREEQVKNTFPLDKEKIKLLAQEYETLLQELGRNDRTAEVIKELGELQAFYLDAQPAAVKNLQEVIAMPRAKANVVAEAKLILADVYLLRGEPWESTLLYSQVEKTHKEQPLGYEAKLRNARLSYYKGDFELAQSHLDILKLATSREIANDALDLSLLIIDNTGMDTSAAALKEYAAIDFLVFQHKYPEALAALDQLLTKYPGHSLTDEIYFQKAELQQQMGQFAEAAQNLQRIIDNPKYDILSDDALFLLAKLNEENLKQPEKAQELYNQLLVKHPGSVFVAEARKRLRKLRGDKV